MTNSNWKPVAHASDCGVHNEPAYPNGPCTCSGTRWHGYGERVGDFAGVWALTGWLAGLSEPEPFAWFVVDASRTRYATVNSEGAALAYIEAKRIGTVLRPMPVYAAPVPPAAVPSVDIADICNAYESGVGHRGRRTANVNPYPSGSHEYDAYAIGAQGNPAAVAASKTEPFLNFNLTQAMALVESFGGLDGDMAVQWFDKAISEDGEAMPAGLYAFCYDYPEEGRQWLGDPMAEIAAPVAPAAPSASPQGTVLVSPEESMTVQMLRARVAELEAAQADDVVRDGAFHVPTLEAVLRGLKSEDDSTQLRAIISEVETILAAQQQKVKP